jgi:hypothetical protein
VNRTTGNGSSGPAIASATASPASDNRCRDRALAGKRRVLRDSGIGPYTQVDAMNLRTLLLTVLVAPTFFMTHEVCVAATLIVYSTADQPDTNPGDGICRGEGLLYHPSFPFSACTLRAAIMEAAANGQTDQILVRPGFYQITRAAYESSSQLDPAVEDFDIQEPGLVIRGVSEDLQDPQPEERPTILGQRAPNEHRIFQVELPAQADSVTLENLRLFGSSDEYGGSIMCRSGTLTLRKTQISNASAEFAGQAIWSTCAVLMSDSRVSDNGESGDDPREDAAIELQHEGDNHGGLRLLRSSIDHNHCAAIHVKGADLRSTLELSSSSILENGNPQLMGINVRLDDPMAAVTIHGSNVTFVGQGSPMELAGAAMTARFSNSIFLGDAVSIDKDTVFEEQAAFESLGHNFWSMPPMGEQLEALPESDIVGLPLGGTEEEIGGLSLAWLPRSPAPTDEAGQATAGNDPPWMFCREFDQAGQPRGPESCDIGAMERSDLFGDGFEY